MLEVLRVSPVAQMVKNLPAMQETGVQSLGQEDTMEKGMAFPPAHSVPFLCPPATPEQRNSIEPSGLQGVALGFRQREAPSSDFHQSSGPLPVSCIGFLGIFPLRKRLCVYF